MDDERFGAVRLNNSLHLIFDFAARQDHPVIDIVVDADSTLHGSLWAIILG